MDYFELLGLNKLPYLDPRQVRDAFHRLSTKYHPDHFHQDSDDARREAHEKYTLLNTANQTLTDPVRRLMYLLSLDETCPEKTSPSLSSVQEASSDLVDLLMETGMLCQNVDRFMVKKEQTNSPMVKVHLFKEGMEWKSKLDTLQDKIQAKYDGVIQEIKDLNPVWSLTDTGKNFQNHRQTIENCLQKLKSLDRASSQIKERQVRLFF